MNPPTAYARSGDVHIAYQVIGTGPIDLVLLPSWVTQVDMAWEGTRMALFLRRLANFSRLILFDKRGTGLSDRGGALPTMEERMDDVRAVMDAVGSARAALFGMSEGGGLCALFAATYPERTSSLIMYGSYARRIWAPDYPWAPTLEQRQRFYDLIETSWGGVVDLEVLAPSVARERRFREWWARYLRAGASPASALALAKMNAEIDVREVLPAINVPTLVLHRSGDQDVDVGGARYLAERIPGARFVELPGRDHLAWVGDAGGILDAVEQFLTGTTGEGEPDRVLATLLFVDIAGSTEMASEQGDREWRGTLDRFRFLVGREVQRHRGREIDQAGDGVLAAFDGPARGVRCAQALMAAVREMGITLRAGLHTGECEVVGDGLAGIAVHIAARVAALAQPGEVLVSRTVHDLVAGSGLEFTDRGRHRLRGVPGEWRLFSLAGS
ncbi:MAG: adenylate/guanylate cyclase domain-containing protein [Candidatus Dormibacteria bacterium]